MQRTPREGPGGATRRRATPEAWQLAFDAADAAWAAAQPLLGGLDPARLGVFAGSSRSAAWTPAPQDSSLHRLVMTTGSALAGSLARRIRACGPQLTLSSACTSSASAIALAADLICAGAIDAALAGGVDLGANPETQALFSLNGLCLANPAGTADPNDTLCLPFDRRSKGIKLGDGAAFLLLARSSILPRREPGHPCVALAGWALGTDPADRCGLASPATTLPRVLREAMAKAGATPDDLLFLHAHGNGNPRGDRAEVATLDSFAAGRSRTPLPIILTKGVTGHCLGATPAMELAFDTTLLPEGLIPPNPHLTDPLPAPRLDLLRATPRHSSEPFSCLVSFGLWGSCAALVLKKF